MALRSAWKPCHCECLAGHKTAGLWNWRKEQERGIISKKIGEKKTEREKTWGFMQRKGFVWNVFCVMRRPNSALWNSVTWSCKIKICACAFLLWSGYSGLTLASSISQKYSSAVFLRFSRQGRLKRVSFFERLLGDCSFFQGRSDTER